MNCLGSTCVWLSFLSRTKEISPDKKLQTKEHCDLFGSFFLPIYENKNKIISFLEHLWPRTIAFLKILKLQLFPFCLLWEFSWDWNWKIALCFYFCSCAENLLWTWIFFKLSGVLLFIVLVLLIFRLPLGFNWYFVVVLVDKKYFQSLSLAVLFF